SGIANKITKSVIKALTSNLKVAFGAVRFDSLKFVSHTYAETNQNIHTKVFRFSKVSKRIICSTSIVRVLGPGQFLDVVKHLRLERKPLVFSHAVHVTTPLYVLLLLFCPSVVGIVGHT